MIFFGFLVIPSSTVPTDLPGNQIHIQTCHSRLLQRLPCKLLRETFFNSDTVRVHPIITKGGAVVNSIPEEACVECQCRVILTQNREQ